MRWIEVWLWLLDELLPGATTVMENAGSTSRGNVVSVSAIAVERNCFPAIWHEGKNTPFVVVVLRIMFLPHAAAEVSLTAAIENAILPPFLPERGNWVVGVSLAIAAAAMDNTVNCRNCR